MDAFVRRFVRHALPFISLVLASVVAAPEKCPAGGPYSYPFCCCPFVDCYTRCAWERTWHGPNALTTPLTPYYIPRYPAPCNCGGFGCNCHGYTGEPYFPAWPEEVEDGPAVCDPSALALESPGFERLGHIPNELQFSVGPAAPNPGRSSR